jgi:hypothetical protein
MISATLQLTKDDLNAAVMEWLEKRGVLTTDRFNVNVKTPPGDRPFDSAYTEITVTGIRIATAT